MTFIQKTDSRAELDASASKVRRNMTRQDSATAVVSLRRVLTRASVVLLVATAAACSSGSGEVTGTGGSGSGGHVDSGGSVSTGGSQVGSGGKGSGGSQVGGGSGSGGSQVGSGGSGSGGNPRSGGTLGSGGVATGGATGAGGAGTGGLTGNSGGNTAGSTATGGSTVGQGGSGTGGSAGQGGSGQDGGAGQGGRDAGGVGGQSGAGGSRPDGGLGGSTGTGGGTGTTFSPCTAGAACKIMPLGDSITEGYGATGNVGGYRIELFRQAAVKAAKNITFVGSLTNGPTTVDSKTFPRNHEGHGGWTISQIAGIADSTLSSNKPDIVLLKIGTNDVNGTGATTAPTGLKNLIDQITKDVPSALLVVSSIIPIKDDNQNQKVKTYNATIPTTVSAAAATGKHVLFVDSYAAFVADASWKTTIMSDNLHPNDTGYALLGQTWYGAISASLP